MLKLKAELNIDVKPDILKVSVYMK